MPSTPSQATRDDPGHLVPTFHSLVLSILLYMALSRLSSFLPSSLLATSLPSALLASVPAAVMLSKFFRPVRYYVRLTTFLLGLATNSIWGLIVAVSMAAVGKKGDVNYVVARSFWKSTSGLLGIAFRVEGEEHLDLEKRKREGQGPVVMVGNHQTMLDILYLGRIFPRRASIMAKASLKYMPLLGQWMYLSDAVFVNRSKREDAVKVMERVGKEMKRKDLSLFIFPEGTRSASPVPSLLPLKKGAFHLAVQAGVPIVPIVCENYAHVYHSRKGRFDGGEVVIRVLPPISTTSYDSSSESIAALVEKTSEAMLSAVEDLGRQRQAALGNSPRAAARALEGADAGEGERTPLLSGTGPTGEGVVGERE
ncbi:hypothetical protein JCM11641_006757 [Rhodosporidiobolus odoratus]